MYVSAYFAFASILLSTAIAAPQYSDDPPQGAASIGQFSNKCAAGMYNVQSGDAGRSGATFSVSFDNFITQYPPPPGEQKDSASLYKSCQFLIPISIRPGYQAKVSNLTLNYFAQLDSGSRVLMQYLTYFTGQTTSSGTKTIEGPVSMDMSENILQSLPQIYRTASLCGESSALNIYISNSLTAPRTNQSPETAQIRQFLGSLEFVRCDTGKNRPWDPKSPPTDQPSNSLPRPPQTDDQNEQNDQNDQSNTQDNSQSSSTQNDDDPRTPQDDD